MCSMPAMYARSPLASAARSSNSYASHFEYRSASHWNRELTWYQPWPVPGRAEHHDGVVSRPQLEARVRRAVVDGDLGLGEGGKHLRQEFVDLCRQRCTFDHRLLLGPFDVGSEGSKVEALRHQCKMRNRYGNRCLVQVASWVRFDSASRASTLRTWLSTVRTDRCIRAAISLFDSPWATSWATSPSRRLSPLGVTSRRVVVPKARAIGAVEVEEPPLLPYPFRFGTQHALADPTDSVGPAAEEGREISAHSCADCRRRRHHLECDGRIFGSDDVRLPD